VAFLLAVSHNFAHCFQNPEDDTEVYYQVSQFYPQPLNGVCVTMIQALQLNGLLGSE